MWLRWRYICVKLPQGRQYKLNFLKGLKLFVIKDKQNKNDISALANNVDCFVIQDLKKELIGLRR